MTCSKGPQGGIEPWPAPPTEPPGALRQHISV